MRSKRDEHRSCSRRLILALLLVASACLVGVFLAVNACPRLLITLLGLKPAGALKDALPPAPALLFPSGEPLDHIDLVLPSQGGEPLRLNAKDAGSGNLWAEPLMGEASTSGTTTYLLTIDEKSLNRFVWELLFPQGLENHRYRDGAVDLQPGGFILYADIHLGIRWQRAGLLLSQDEGALTLSPAGVVLRGELYRLPESGSLTRYLLPAGRPAQRALSDLAIVGPLPGEARVEATRFHDDHLQILTRATYAVPTPSDTGWQALERGAELREIDVATGAERLSIMRLNPTDLNVRVHYDPVNPKRISAWGTTLDALLVVNGSYFAPESESGSETIGLLISEGRRWGSPLPDYAGMLAVTRAGDVSVRWLRHRPYDPEEPLTQAMQSFPVLVRPGGVMGFPADADDGTPSRRTLVAQDGEGNILIIVAPRGTLSLHDLAAFLVESDLAIDAALNLDGGGSTGMWVASAHTRLEIDSFTPVPSVIAVERP